MYVKIIGYIGTNIKSRELRFPIGKVAWWGESLNPNFQTDIKFSMELELKELDKKLGKALEKKENLF